MKDLTFVTPVAAGAARVRLIDPLGRFFDTLSTPGANTSSIVDAAFGLYTAVVEPLGRRPHIYNFDFGPDSGPVIASAELEARTSATTVAVAAEAVAPASAEAIADPAPRDQIPVGLGVMTTPSADPFFFLGDAERTVAERVSHDDVTQPAPEVEGPAALSIGLSHDTLPYDPGGWRPFYGYAPEIEQTADSLTIVFPRAEEPLRPADAGGRLKLSVALERRGIERLLVPLFVGGVRVELRLLPGSALDLDLSVVPIDPERLALAQALEAGVSKEGQAIYESFASRHSVERYIRDDSVHDPWTGILAGLLSARFEGVGPSEGFTWIPELSQSFGWITDAFVLDAKLLMKTNPRDEGARLANSEQALEKIRQARHVGAPYFLDANTMAGDLLAKLVGAVEADPELRGEERRLAHLAREEHQLWQRFIRKQRSAGAFFTWRTAWYASTTENSLDRRYAATIWRGVVEDGEIRPEN